MGYGYYAHLLRHCIEHLDPLSYSRDAHGIRACHSCMHPIAACWRADGELVFATRSDSATHGLSLASSKAVLESSQRVLLGKYRVLGSTIKPCFEGKDFVSLRAPPRGRPSLITPSQTLITPSQRRRRPGHWRPGKGTASAAASSRIWCSIRADGSKASADISERAGLFPCAASRALRGRLPHDTVCDLDMAARVAACGAAVSRISLSFAVDMASSQLFGHEQGQQPVRPRLAGSHFRSSCTRRSCRERSPWALLEIGGNHFLSPRIVSKI